MRGLNLEIFVTSSGPLQGTLGYLSVPKWGGEGPHTALKDLNGVVGEVFASL